MSGIGKLMRMLREHSGPGFKSRPRQLAEVAEMLLRAHLHPGEYYTYNFSRREVGRSEIASYVGNDLYWHELLPRLNQSTWRTLTSNKWLFQLHYEHTGLLPVAYGIFHRLNGATREGAPLRTASDLTELLRRGRIQGFVAKPVHGWKGEGVTVVDQVDPDGERLLARDGARLQVDELVRRFHPNGMILQERLAQCPTLNDIAVDGNHTIRVVTLIGADDDVHALSATIKMGSRGSMVDNFAAGATSAYVHPKSGSIGRSRARQDLSTSQAVRPSLEGKVVPRWPEILDAVRRVARAAPGLRAVGWDLILTNRQPYVIEGNDDFDVMGQQALGHRLLSEESARLFGELGLTTYAPGPPAVSTPQGFASPGPARSPSSSSRSARCVFGSRRSSSKYRVTIERASSALATFR